MTTTTADDDRPASSARRAEPAARVVRDAAVAAAVCCALALAANALRPSGALPLVAAHPYQIHVPCPDLKGEVAAMSPGDPRLGDAAAAAGTLVLDARERAEFARWHLPSARSLPYDFVAPVAAKQIQEVAASGARLVVVYGDGQDPDSGRELARELASKGIRGVHYVAGGAPALGAAAAAPGATQPSSPGGTP